MPLGEALDDDYVINLLKSDATRISSARPRAKDAPKPNIRFLRNVIRETDSHNAALKAKEAEDSRQKLLELKRQERSGGGKRKRNSEEGGRGEGRAEKKPRSGERNGRWASALGGLGKVRSGERDSRSEIKVKGAAAESGKRRRDDSRERHVEDERRTKKQPEPEERPRHSERKHSKERRRRDEDVSERSRSPQRRRKVDHDRHSSVRDEVNDDSDPLESIIGPRPAITVRPRGRGAQNASISSSTIDARFAADYDPSADIHPDHDVNGGEGDDDWGMALSALQARTRFKASQKDRLKAAGFTEEEVGRWEKGGKVEKDVGDVRWKKKGEGREWDAGKEVGDEEGRLETKVAWAK
ncbi:hypothetical protein LTR17_016961 [Elasticomyces elasticus]|nr:hypothetical protein LTR17_016961 [Elasticomyces elasticus]